MAGSSVDVCENSVCFLCDFSGEYIRIFGEYSLIEYSVVSTRLVTRVVQWCRFYCGGFGYWNSWCW